MAPGVVLHLNIRLTDRLALFPGGYAGIVHLRLISRRETSSETFPLWTVEVPLLVHLAEHLFFGVGPELQLAKRYGLGAVGDTQVMFNVRGSIGGWF